MPEIVRAEFLKYHDPSRNSDKVFNIFLVEEAGGTFACVTEYGRRWTRLIRDTLCAGASRAAAESLFRRKLAAKCNHRETPYSADTSATPYSRVAEEYGFAGSNNTKEASSEQSVSTGQCAKVIQFPDKKKSVPARSKPEKSGILNCDQFSSLEI